MKLLSPSAREFIKLPEAERRAKWNALRPDEQELVRVETRRIQRIMEYPTPGDLAVSLDPATVQTPALTIIDSKLVQISQAIEVMYARRRRLQELLAQGVNDKIAIERATEEIPSRGITRLILSMSPQEGKSSRVSRYGLEWLLRQYPALRITLVSYDGVNAGQFSYQVRSDIELFDGTSNNVDIGLRLMRDQKAMGRWMLETGGGVYAIGIGGGLTGHPSDLMNIDDPVKDIRAADSTLQSRQHMEWWETTARPRLAPWAPVMLTMTRWSDNDLAGQLIRKRDEDIMSGVKDYDDWTVVNIPAQADFNAAKGESDILGREVGEYMVSARGRTNADWEATKNATSARYWSALYQGNPTPGTGAILLREWWQRYERVMWVQHGGAFHVEGGYELVQSWDFAFKETKTSDFVVGQVWAKKGADSFLIYQVRDRLSLPRTIDAMRRVSMLFPQAKRKYFENRANGPEVHKALRHEIAGLIPVNPTSSKEARAEAASPIIRSGNIYLPSVAVSKAIPELTFDVEQFIDECVSINTMIFTRRGVIEASEVVVGDWVLTHLGRFREVLEVSRRQAPATIELTAKTLDPLRLTPEHPVLSMVMSNASEPNGKFAQAIAWKAAGELSPRAFRRVSNGTLQPSPKMSDALTFPVLDEDYEVESIDLREWYDYPGEPKSGTRSLTVTDDGEYISVNSVRAQSLKYAQKLDYDFGRFCGLWLAEGSYSSGRAQWSFNAAEISFIDEIQSLLLDRFGIRSATFTAVRSPNCTVVSASLPRLERWFKSFGHKAFGKRIPEWAWAAPLVFHQGLIDGWLDGDGHDGRGTTVSPHLAWGMRLIATRMGVWPKLTRATPRFHPERRIQGRHTTFTVDMNAKSRTTEVWADDDGDKLLGFWVRSVADTGPCEVINFHVDEDESYVTTGGTVHNCTAFNHGAHDDIVDALTYYINEVYGTGPTTISSPVGTGPKPRVTPPAEESEIARRIREKRSA